MAKDTIKGITVAVGGDTTGLQKALTDVNKKSSQLNSELREVERELKLDPTNTTLLAQKQELLAEKVSNASLKLRELQSVQEKVEGRYKSGEIGADAYRAFQREIIITEQSLKSFEKQQSELEKANNATATAVDTLRDKIRGEEKELSKLKSEYSNVVLEQGKNSNAAKGLAKIIQALDSQLNGDREKIEKAEEATDKLTESQEDANEETEKAEKETKSYGKALKGLKDIAAKAGQAIIDIAKAAGEMALNGMKAATKVGSDFESSVSQLAATMGKSTDEITTLTDKAKELGSTTQFSASQAADGLNILAMAGLNAEQQTEAIGSVLNLAAAGSLSLEQAASYTTGAVKGFGDEMENAQKYADLMAKGATLANTDVNGLGAALSGASATAKSYGQDAEGVTLSLLRLAEQNVTGEQAATMLSRAMTDLYTPTDAAKKALDELGIAAYDSNGKARDFTVITDELNKKLSGMTEEQANAYKATIFTTNGLNGFNKMMASSPEKVEAFKNGLADAAGSAENQAKTMIDNLQGDITIMQSAAEGLGITFYETFNDDLRSSVRFATDSLGKLTEAFENNGLEGAADVAGTIISDIANKAVEYAPTLIETVTTLIDSISNTLSENSGNIAQSAGKLITSIANGLTSNSWTIMNAAENILRFVLKELPNVINTLLGSAGDYVSKVINFLVDISAIVMNALPDIIKELINKISDTVSIRLPQIISSITRLMSVVAKNLPQIIKSVIDELPALLTMILNSLKDNVPVLLNGIIEMVETILTQLTPILSTTLPTLISIITDFLPEIINNIVNVIFENLPILLEGVSMLVMGIVNALPSMIENIIGMIPVLVMNIVNALTGSLPSIIQTIGILILGIAKVLPDLIVSIIDVLPDLINLIVGTLTTFLPIFIETGIVLFTAIIEDLPQIINGIVEKLPEIIDSIMNALLDALPVLIDCGVDLFLALIENLPVIIMEIQECIPQIIEGIAKAAIELFPRIVTVGVQLFMSLVENLPDIISKLKKRMPEIITGLVDKLKEHIHKMKDIGKNLIEGIWDGIKNAKDWLIEKVSGWCNTITDSIKDFFGIHSPSTLFRDTIGNNLALGIGEGFVDTMADVTDDMTDSLPTSFDIDPNVNLVSGDSRMQTFNNAPVPSKTSQPVQSGGVINFTLQIDNFNNTANTSVNDLSETITTTLYELIRRNKLAVI